MDEVFYFMLIAVLYQIIDNINLVDKYLSRPLPSEKNK
jgi:hypothetical protein